MRKLWPGACLVGSLVCSSASARDGWLQAKSEHFAVVTDAGKGRAKDVLYDLEQLRRLIIESLPSQPVDSHIPTGIYLFKSEKSFRDYQPLRDGKPEGWTALFQGMGFENFIAVQAMGSKDELRETMFTQYMHLLLSYNDVQYPLWLGNGLSLFYANAQVRKDYADVGKVHQRHRRELGEFRSIPLEEMFAVDQSSAYYRDPNARALYDAQCWALAHYLLIGRNPEGSAQLAKFLSLLADGKDELSAFQEALGMPLPEIQSTVGRYIRKDISQYRRVELSPLDMDREFRVVELSPAAEGAVLGALLVAVGRHDEARRRLTAAVETDPARPEAYEALGFLEAIEKNRDQSLSHLEQAVAKGSTNPMAHLYYAKALLSDYEGAVTNVPQPTRGAALASLRRTLDAEPFHTEAARLYGFLSLFGGSEDFAVGLAVVGRALEKHRGQPQLLFIVGQLYAKQENYTAAKLVYEKLLSRKLSPSMTAMVRRQLDYVLAKAGSSP